MIVERLISWVETVAAVYVFLLATYLATALVIERMNRRLVAAKIQARTTTAALIARDRRQSFVSLAAIAAMFGTGHWMYAEFGWGWAPATSIGGMVLCLSPRWCCSTPGSTGCTG